MANDLAVPGGDKQSFFSKLFKKKEKPFTGEKMKVGIIGCGWIAGSHVTEYKKMNDVEIVAVADLVEGKAEKFARKYGLKCRTYRSHKELIDNEKLDIVSVCTYNKTHAECTIYALNNGVNVMCEKPMCVTIEEAIAMTKAAKESGKKLSIGFQPRMDPNFQELKKVVQSGELGKVYYVQTGGGRTNGIPTPFGTSFIDSETAGIGAVGDIGCYSLDLVMNALGYPKPLTVSGYLNDSFGKDPKTYIGHPEYADKFGVDDFAAGFIRLEGGICLDFRIAWAMNLNTPGDTLFFGTKKALRVPSTPCWNGSIPKAMELSRVNQTTGLITKKKIKKFASPNVFYLKIRGFVDAVRNNTDVSAPPEQIIYNQAIIDGIVRSAKLGKEVEIELPKF